MLAFPRHASEEFEALHDVVELDADGLRSVPQGGVFNPEPTGLIHAWMDSLRGGTLAPVGGALPFLHDSV